MVTPSLPQPSAGFRMTPRDLKALLLLALVALLLHGHGLWLGFWLDDHNHLELCRENGYASLVSGNTFDWNRRIAHVWWARQETGWAYFRPFAILLRTLLLNGFGWNPLPFHIVHLLCYTASVLLFYVVIRRWGGGTGMGLLAGLLFTTHPTHSMAATWLACDGPVLVADWTFLSLWLLRVSMEKGHRSAGPWIGMMLCYALAMTSRESGLMLGPILVFCDWLAGLPGDRATAGTANFPGRLLAFFRVSGRRFALYCLLGAEAILFIALRHHYLEGLPVPHRPYYTWPSTPGFASWIFHKALSDFCSLTLGLPFFPIVNVGWLQEHHVTTAVLILLAIAVLCVVLIPLRRSRVMWAVVAAMILFAAPTLPAISAAYSYYLISAGWVVLLVMLAAKFKPRWPRAVTAILCLVFAMNLVGLWGGTWLLYACTSAEKMTRDSVEAADPAHFPRETHVFFINLPFFAMEAGPAIRLASGRPDLDFCPLTLAPDAFAPGRSVTVQPENNHTLLMRIDPPGWFSGRFGEQVGLGWFGACRGDFPVGPVAIPPFAGKLPFRVEIVERDIRGIAALRFVFDKPLGDPGYRFFLGAYSECAQPLHFTADGTMSLDPATPAQQRIMGRLRRMQGSFNRMVSFLDRLP